MIGVSLQLNITALIPYPSLLLMSRLVVLQTITDYNEDIYKLVLVTCIPNIIMMWKKGNRKRGRSLETGNYSLNPKTKLRYMNSHHYEGSHHVPVKCKLPLASHQQVALAFMDDKGLVPA